MAKNTQTDPENEGGAPGGEKLPGGHPPTGDKPGPDAAALQEQLEGGTPDANTIAPEFNPTTPDGKPPANNLPGPHGPQGVSHLQTDPAAE